MHRRLQSEVDKVKQMLLSLGADVEERVGLAVRSVEEINHPLASKVIDSDIEIDKIEVDLEEECLKLLALYQPVATDLRYIIAILKINNDLERIGDLAVNIAERTVLLAEKETRVDFPFDFSTTAHKVQSMLRRSLDSFVNQDARQAYIVTEDDDEIDEINRNTYKIVGDKIREDPSNVDWYIHILDISHHLERIADHATNIAEDVVYMSRGEIMRHRIGEYKFLKENHQKE